MKVITQGEVRLRRLDADGVAIHVRAPGMHVEWRSVPVAAFTEAMASPNEWSRAIAENGLAPFAAVEARPLAVQVETAAPVLTVPQSADSFVEVRATPPPGEGLLVMSESNGIVQWHLPTNALPAIQGAAAAAPESVHGAELHFLIPRSTLASRGATTGFTESVGGAIVHFFRFQLIQELLSGTIERILQWIAQQVEAKTKQEGFRFFDRDKDFPYISAADLQSLAGQRILLLTHGLFSSLPGAFADIADPAGPVLKHLRGIYGRNILGWDHWTVAKTPLETATDLLANLPANVRPDIVCHSRGALVTRAMLEHPSLQASRESKFSAVGKAIFVAGGCQGSQLVTFANLNRLLNIYSAVGSLPILGSAGVVLQVIVGILRVLAHGVTRLPSFEALSSDLTKNTFLRELNESVMAPTGEVVVVHANYDPSKGPLAGLLDLNVDAIFNAANDMVVPYTGAEVFDQWQQVGTNLRFGSTTETQPVVMHTNFFAQPGVRELLQAELV